MILDNNVKLAENAVLSVEDSLSKVFQERSNQVFQKLENILTIFKEEKVSTSHFNQSSGSGHDDISREKIDAVFARLFLAEKAACLLYTSPSPRDYAASRMPSSA